MFSSRSGHKLYSHSGGRRTVRRPGVMNGLEREYARHLDLLKLQGAVLDYSFDCLKLRLAEKTFYTPDFLVIMADCALEIHEVKGSSKGKPYVEDDAAVKIKVAADAFPFKFVMVWKVHGDWQTKEY